MPDRKLTNNEIIKALEYEIEIAKAVDDNMAYTVEMSVLTNTLDLINRLQAENERLEDFATAKCEDCAGCTSWKCDCANIEEHAKAEAYKECLKKFGKNIKDVQVTLGQAWEIQNALKKTLKELVGDSDA